MPVVFKDSNTGFPRALEIVENLEIKKKSSMHGKIMEFTKLPVARKLAVRHASFACLTANFLATGGLKF